MKMTLCASIRLTDKIIIHNNKDKCFYVFVSLSEVLAGRILRIWQEEFYKMPCALIS